jgi:hypothetical protein
MPVVKYNDRQGYSWAMLVPEEEKLDYSRGAILGPPDLTSLGLTEQTLKKLHKLLVESNLYNAAQLMGNRKRLVQIIQQLNLDRKLVREITMIYQREYYSNGEMENG